MDTILSDTDESFTWAVKSNASSISDIESMSLVELQNGHIHPPKKNKVNKCLEDMESTPDIVRSKKRKIKKSIGSDSEGHYSPKKRKVNNDESHEEKNDKKKIKQKIIFENSSDIDYLDIKVKNEELSASDTSHNKSKKKKRKKHSDPVNLNESEDLVENHLYLEVKQEPSSNDSVKIKKNKRHESLDLKNGSEETDEHSFTARVKKELDFSDSTPVKLKKKKKSKHSVSSNFDSQTDVENLDEKYLNILVLKEEDDTFTKPKAKKKKQDLDNVNQIKDVSLETFVHTPKKKNRKSESINTESESESTKKSKKKKHKQLVNYDNDSILFNSERDGDQHTLSETSHLESSRLNEKEQTSIKLKSKKNSTSDDNNLGSSWEKGDRKFSSHITSDEDIPENKTTSRKSSVNNNVSPDKHKPSITVTKSPQVQGPRKNISKEMISDDSSSDNDSSTGNKHTPSQSTKYNNTKRTINKGNSDGDEEKSLAPPSQPHQNNKQLNNRSDSSDENNSVEDKSASTAPISKSPNIQQSSRTFSINYDTSDETSSGQDKAQNVAKSPQARRQLFNNVSNRTVSKGSSTDEEEAVPSKSILKSPKKKSNSISRRTISKSDDSSDKDSPSKKPVLSKKVTSRRITDLIRFKQDDSDKEDKNDDTSSELQLYQKSNSNLHPIVTKPNNNAVITDDDEIWILKCPSDVNVGTLKDSEFLLDKKCKFKMNGETYHGTVENDIEKVTITTFEQNGFVIKNLPVNGVVHVKKRIPKQHVQDDSVLMQSHNDFIPLPETKCRHPFFGADYKKAIKVPKRIAQYLKADYEDLQSPEEYIKEKKKKDKKRLKDCVKDEPQEKVTEEVVTEKRKKTKKRKHHDSDEVPAKKAKKKKHESSEVWDSEKAIEENLFNY